MCDHNIWQPEQVSCPTLESADGSNVSEQMIEKGLATVLRHKRDDEDRSAELDKLIVAEQT
jgi:staphylococcal nuclease domain-containing protein 1